MAMDALAPKGPYPTLEELLSSPDPERALEVRRAVRSTLSGIALFILTAVAVYVINVLFYDWQPPQDIPIIRNLSLRGLAIVPAIILLELVRRYHDDLYVFGTERVQHYEGRLSLAYSVPAIRYSHIRAITVYQDLLGRIFDYGDITIGTAGHDGSEIFMGGIRNPRHLAKLIYNLKMHQTDSEAIAIEQGAETGMQSLVANTD